MISPMEVVGSTEEMRILPMSAPLAHDQHLRIWHDALAIPHAQDDEVVGLVDRQNRAVHSRRVPARFASFFLLLDRRDAVLGRFDLVRQKGFLLLGRFELLFGLSSIAFNSLGEPLSGVPGTPATVASATRFWRSAIWSSLACSLASISAFSFCALVSSASALVAFASAAVALRCAAAKSVSRAFSFFSLAVRARSEISRAEMCS